jgi:hypothetical protein
LVFGWYVDSEGSYTTGRRPGGHVLENSFMGVPKARTGLGEIAIGFVKIDLGVKRIL